MMVFDLNFLWDNFGVQIIPFKWKKFQKKIHRRGEKKIVRGKY